MSDFATRIDLIACAAKVLCGCIWTPPFCNALVRVGWVSRLLTYIRPLNAARSIVAESPDGSWEKVLAKHYTIRRPHQLSARAVFRCKSRIEKEAIGS